MDENRLQEYIRSYQDLLTEKGYDENTLMEYGSTDTMKSLLEKGFREANENAAGAETMEIQLRMIGKIGAEQKTIAFQFVFILTPAAGTIKLRNIDAYNGNIMATIFPDTNSSIPSSLEVYETLKEQEGLKQSMEVIKKHSARKGRGLN